MLIAGMRAPAGLQCVDFFLLDSWQAPRATARIWLLGFGLFVGSWIGQSWATGFKSSVVRNEAA